MAASPPEDRPAPGRRALIAGGLGVAALLAAPAEACFLVATGGMPDTMLTNERARAYLKALLSEVNKGEQATSEALGKLPPFEIFTGSETLSRFEAPRMLVSHGRRDSAPAALENMLLLTRGGYVRLYLVGLRRTLYHPPPPEREDGCNRSPEEGYHTRLQMWLYRYHPDRAALIRQPELDEDKFALLPGPAKKRA